MQCSGIDKHGFIVKIVPSQVTITSSASLQNVHTSFSIYFTGFSYNFSIIFRPILSIDVLKHCFFRSDMPHNIHCVSSPRVVYRTFLAASMVPVTKEVSHGATAHRKWLVMSMIEIYAARFATVFSIVLSSTNVVQCWNLYFKYGPQLKTVAFFVLRAWIKSIFPFISLLFRIF